ncbi:MAG: cell division protein FtsL [Gammaproteobacteria bacterium]|nr:cell division protein FtsL [Gammaproteobacteria bacterium]
MNIYVLTAVLLGCLVMGSSIAVIYTKHESRKLFVELQKTNREIDKLNINWGRLQLEQSAWSSHGRIEKIATARLNMRLPVANEVVYIKE